MQAGLYQLLGMVAIVGLWTLWGIFYAITMIPMVQNAERYEAAPPPAFWLGLATMAVSLLVMVIWGLYGLWGALRCRRGDEFRHALLGKRLLA